MLRGIGMFLGTPGVRLLGIVPVLLAALLVLSLLGLLVVYLDELAGTLTPFADRWDESSRTLVRVGTGLVLLLGSTAVLVVSFTVIAQIIGQPFYERISDRIEHRLGEPPAGADAPWWRTFPRASLESALLLVMTLACTAPLFVLGLFPVFGQTVVPVLQALVAGFFLAVELLAIPLERRGLHLAGRLRFVWRHRAQTLGFGITAFLLFLVPLMAVLAMPGAVVGGPCWCGGSAATRPGGPDHREPGGPEDAAAAADQVGQVVGGVLRPRVGHLAGDPPDAPLPLPRLTDLDLAARLDALHPRDLDLHASLLHGGSNSCSILLPRWVTHHRRRRGCGGRRPSPSLACTTTNPEPAKASCTASPLPRPIRAPAFMVRWMLVLRSALQAIAAWAST